MIFITEKDKKTPVATPENYVTLKTRKMNNIAISNKEMAVRRALLTGLIILLTILAVYRVHELIQSAGFANPEYNFRATRRLLTGVEKGARLLERQGEKAFAIFNSRDFRNRDFYLYVYRASDSHCLYHGGSPELVAKTGTNFYDVQGKNIHGLIKSELSNRDNPYCWIHYLWTRPQQILAQWKSSCHRRVTMPDKTICYIGGGVNNTVYETQFARIAVNSAASLLAQKGEPALAMIVAPENNYNFLDTSVFVLNEEGVSIIDPVFKRFRNRDMKQYRDASGRYPFQLLFKKMKQADSAIAPLYTVMPQSMNLRKKMIYAKKTLMDGKLVVVGMAMNTPENIWQQ